MNRMSPGQHPGIHKGAVRADTDPGDVRVIVNQLRRIDVLKRTLDQIGGLRADAAFEFLRPVCERATDVMKQAHVQIIG